MTTYTTKGNLWCQPCGRSVPPDTDGFTDGKNFICPDCHRKWQQRPAAAKLPQTPVRRIRRVAMDSQPREVE